MRLVRDVPDRLLDLEESPTHVDRYDRWYFILFLLQVLPIIPISVALESAEESRRFPVPWECMGISFVVWSSLITLLYFYDSRSVRRLTVDRDEGHLSIHQTSLRGLLSRATSIPLAELERVSLCTDTQWGRLSTELPLEVRVRSRRGREERCRIGIEGVYDRDDLLDFALRLARATGLWGHAITRSDDPVFEVVLDSRETLPVPQPDRPARYMHEVGTVRSVRLEDLGSRFDPKSFHSWFRVDYWVPGTLVRLARPNCAPLGCLSLVLLPLATGGGHTIWSALHDTDRWRWVGLVLGFAFSALPFALLVGAAAAGRAQRSVIDWTTRRITHVRGWRTQVIPFDELSSIETRAVRIHSNGWKNGPGEYSRYEIQVWANARTGAAMLAEACDEPETPRTPFDCPLPLGIELAAALGVPHRYTYYQ